MICAVGFDLDGTLFDHRGAASSGLASLLAQQGWIYEGTAEFGAEWERIEQLHFGDYIAGKLTLAEQRRERLRDFLAQADVELPDSDLDDLFEEYLRHYAKSWVAFPDALPVLENLRHLGFRMAVLTNGLQEQQEAKLARLGLSEFFDSVLAIGTLTAPKPDERAFVELAAAVGHSPDEIVYVGDDPHWDALAATKAGLRGVWLNREDRVGPEGIHTEVRALDALVSVIQTWNRPTS